MLTEFSEKIILHLTKNEVDLTSACLSWVVHFLVPEFEKLQIIVQFWDKYIVARTQMGLFHCCLCVSILHHYEKEILGMNAEEILLFFQSPPLLNMTSTEIAQIIQFATHIFEKNRLFVSNIKCIINDTNTQNPEIVINNESTNDTQ